MKRVIKSSMYIAIAVQVLQAAAIAQGEAVLWENVNIRARDLYGGPGGSAMKPDLRSIKFLEDEKGGNNLKYRIQDASGRIWVAKIADESQSEVAATRLLYGIGYATEIDYLVPELTMPGKKKYKNVRLEARPADVTRDGRWSWKANPFADKPEFYGLKLMMALINNWDLKDENTAVLVSGGRRHFVVSDLGSSFGKLSPTSAPILNRFGRSVNNPAHYSNSNFVKGVNEQGELELAYRGKQAGLMDGLTVNDARWLANLLGQLSDKQIADAFRTANYNRAQVKAMTAEVKQRIAELKSVGRTYEARR